MTRQRQPDLPDGAHTDTPEKPKPATHTDEALRLAAKIDRLLEKMPAWARQWALNFLWAKWMQPNSMPGMLRQKSTEAREEEPKP